MTIEVKQMLVKSTVLQEQDEEAKGSAPNPCQDLDEMKEDILAECRRFILQMLRERQER